MLNVCSPNKFPICIGSGETNWYGNTFLFQEKSNKNPMEKQMERYGYPPPAPPHQRKKEVFDVNDSKALDKYASKVRFTP